MTRKPKSTRKRPKPKWANFKMKPPRVLDFSQGRSDTNAQKPKEILTRIAMLKDETSKKGPKSEAVHVVVCTAEHDQPSNLLKRATTDNYQHQLDQHSHEEHDMTKKFSTPSALSRLQASAKKVGLIDSNSNESSDWDDVLIDDDDPEADNGSDSTASPKEISGKRKERRAIEAKLLDRKTKLARKADRTKRKAKPKAVAVPAANDDELPSQPGRLPLCADVAQVEGWLKQTNATFIEKMGKAFVRLRKLAPVETMDAIHRVLEGKATDVPSPISYQVCADAAGHLHRAFAAAVDADPAIEIVMVSRVSGDGETSSDRPVLDLSIESASARRLARAISPNYIGIIEVDMFSSRKHEHGGRMLCSHSHTFFWGHDVVAKAEAEANRLNESLPASFTGAPVFKASAVATDDVNLARMGAYGFKAPAKAKNWCPPTEHRSGHMNHSEKGDRSILYLRMAMIRSMLSLEDVVFAGGEGKAIRRGLIDLARQSCKSYVPHPDRMLAPDTIGALWVEVSKALDRPKWHLPVILRRP